MYGHTEINLTGTYNSLYIIFQIPAQVYAGYYQNLIKLICKDW